ncbi:TetR/AcrR family transcriptional regulator C-terminal domain-containing protein [Flintibacter muris]|uniref:TetR/AcrR family transcriptional regulator C-terminal domain-containing protein n=1 Tax=Flintibacter muris TaxID=2941327 RepID=UPI00203F8579|nr:TetR/AcrR family transcriptional regulator C-terminal domain-containing protein [Flintibacter muris]
MKQAELSYNRKRQLADSLKMLMVKKNLKKITVQEIADGCGANRYTFYYHFKDIYDLLMWMFQEEALSLIKTSENCLTWQEGFRLFLRWITENNSVCKCALNDIGQEALREMFYQETKHLMTLFLADAKGSHQVSDEYLAFLGDLYMAALSGILLEWIRRDLDFSEDQLMSYLWPTMDQIRMSIQQAEQAGL